MTKHDYIIASEPITHPETLEEIVHEGQWLSTEDLKTLNREFGVDQVIGYLVKWPT